MKIRLLEAGWDNTAFVLNEDLIFRFLRRESVAALLETQWCIPPKLAPRLSLPIRILKWPGAPALRFSWLFISYKRLPGFTACDANLLEEERDRLAEPIAHCLADLHSTPVLLLLKDAQGINAALRLSDDFVTRMSFTRMRFCCDQ